VSTPIEALVARARAAADETSATSVSPEADRLKLQRLASEFESMLLNQVLAEMRKTGHWESDSEEESDGFGAKALFETLDAEFSKQMSRAQGLGLGSQLMTAFDRMQGTSSASGDDMPLGTSGLGIDLSLIQRDPSDGAADLVGAVPLDATGGSANRASDVAYAVERMRRTALDPVAVGRQRLDTDSVISDAKSSTVTSGFGWRRDPLTGETKFHKGVDLRAAYGQDVAAAAGGKVAFSGAQGSYGTTVVIQHPDGSTSRYAHLSVALVATGETVEPGQLVGQAGSSGRSTGPHVQLEVTDRNGRPMNPLHLPGSGD
jgi:murein DD-endopeptidase MepM/ murein hydrolase activator NlpD